MIRKCKLVLAVMLLAAIPGSLGSTGDHQITDTEYSALDSLETLLREESDLLLSFEYLLHVTPKTPETRMEFLISFEDLLRRQAILFKGFEDLLKLHWDGMGVDEQEKFLASFEDLLDREVILFNSFKELFTQSWGDLNAEEQTRLVRSFEDLLRRQSDLIKSYEDLLKKKRGGISIEKRADKTTISSGETVTYTYIIRSYYEDKTITDIFIEDDQLGIIVNGVQLGPMETKSFTKTVVLTRSTCNTAKVMGRGRDGKIVSDRSNEVCVLVRGGGIPEPLQYEQYCNSQKVAGEGNVDMDTSIVDKAIALEYENALSGSGKIEFTSEHTFSENASRLQRRVGNKTIPLNFHESTSILYSGETPLAGTKRLRSDNFHGGIGAQVEEMFSVMEMEKIQTAFFASTDPTTHLNDYDEAQRIMSVSPVHLVGLDTGISFSGSWGTESIWYKILKKDIRDRQLFTGKFETEKLIKFHESPIPEPQIAPCEGIDC